MKVMVIGGGGREHAIIKKLKENKEIDEIYCLPGNGGIADDAICVNIAATDIERACEFAMAENIDFAVVAPDDPLVLGMTDALEEKGVKCFGPHKNAAVIEGSKVFSKNLMKKYNIPTADYETFDNAAAALSYMQKNEKYPIVIKADGLALGKGVLICMNKEEALAGIREIMEDKKFGESGRNIVVEEFLEGPEVTLLSFTDGKVCVPMVSSMDHKRAHDNDEGLNTGGMGCIAPNPFFTDDVLKETMEKIVKPTISAMNAEGRPFKGCLYFGLMITKDGPKVIEYNCRFGDPETQVVLPLLETDLFEIFKAVSEERLASLDIKFSDKCSCTVIAASDGYPLSYEKGFEVSINESALQEGETVYHAGTKLIGGGKLVTNGGRVLAVTAVEKDLPNAVKKAYDAIKNVHFENMYYRHDIGKRALEEIK